MLVSGWSDPGGSESVGESGNELGLGEKVWVEAERDESGWIEEGIGKVRVCRKSSDTANSECSRVRESFEERSNPSL